MASNSTDGGPASLNDTTSTLLPGQSAPLTVVTATDQTGIVVIGTVLALIFAFISIFLRLFIRFQFRHEFARDDIVALVAMVSLFFAVLLLDPMADC